MQKSEKDFLVLGLSENANKEQVQKAYSILLKRYKDNPEKLVDVTGAYNRIMGYSEEDEQKDKDKDKDKMRKLFGFLTRNKEKK
jgi:hypothetical protein